MGLYDRKTRGFDRTERGDGVSNIRDLGLEGFEDWGFLRHSSREGLTNKISSCRVKSGADGSYGGDGIDMSMNRGQRASRIVTLILKWTRDAPLSTPRIPSFLLNVTNYSGVRLLHELSLR